MWTKRHLVWLLLFHVAGSAVHTGSRSGAVTPSEGRQAGVEPAFHRNLERYDAAVLHSMKPTKPASMLLHYCGFRHFLSFFCFHL